MLLCRFYTVFVASFLVFAAAPTKSHTPEPTEDYLKAPIILTEHIDYIYLRLSHLLAQTPEDIWSLRTLLAKELENSAPYKEAWTEGTALFQTKKSQLVDPEDEGKIPDEYHIALIAYTLHDTPSDWAFYSVFNTATRNLATGLQVDQYPFKSFLQLLRLAIQALQVAFQQFSSLSADRKVSESYSKGVTLMVFENMRNLGIKLVHHSAFPGESEILVSPLQVFKVTDTEVPGCEGYDEFTLQPINDGSGFEYYSAEGKPK